MDKITKPKGDKYETTDQNLVMALLMQNYSYSTRISAERQIIYVFDMCEVWGTIEKILTNDSDDLVFNYPSYWKATTIWQMNLRHLSTVRGKL